MNWICKIFRRKKKVKKTFNWENNLREWTKEEQKLCELINLYRLQNNLPFLKPDKYCREQMQIRTDYCIYRKMATHEQMGIVQQNIQKVGLRYFRENLAAGYFNAESAFKGWQRSTAHNETLLSKKGVYLGISCGIDEYFNNYVSLGVFY